MSNIITIRTKEDFDKISSNTEILIIEYLVNSNWDHKNIFTNLPPLLGQIHFNNEYYIYSDPDTYPDTYQDTYQDTDQFEIQLPHHCKIYHIGKQLINFNNRIGVAQSMPSGSANWSCLRENVNIFIL